MVFPWAAAIGAGGALGSGLLNLFGQQNQQGNQQQALQLAMQNYLLQKRAQEQQYELATAGRQDARGNKVRYVPGRGWVTDLTPESQSQVAQSDALQRQAMLTQLTRGENERSLGYSRRLKEGSAADPLLAAVMHGYGAPTKEAVSGRNTIANVTQASENADNIRRGYAGAALRTGSGTVPLAANMASIDRGGTAGIRSALARSQSEADPLFQAQLQQFQQGKLNPYNMLATRAGNANDMPFQPEQITTQLGNQLDKSGTLAAGYGVRGMTPNIAGVLSAYGNQRTPNYDTFVAGLTENLKGFFNKPSGNGIPWNEDSRNPGAYNNWSF